MISKVKNILVALLVFAASPPLVRVGASAAAPTEVRVGLESKFFEKDAVAVGGAVDLGVEKDGRFVVCASVVSSGGGFSFRPEYGYCSDAGSAASFLDALEQCSKFNGNAVPAVNKDGWRVYFVSSEPLSGFTASSSRVSLYDGGARYVVFDGVNPQVRAIQGFTHVGDYEFRGRVEFGRYAGKKVTAVNVLSFDEYLYGVVPSEMPASWHSEALKAQAVASRTYSYSKILSTNHAAGYSLCDKDHCQVYGGALKEDSRANAAVDATSGVMIYYDGKPIEAFFFASSGGFTEDVENVWITALPYLRGVADVYETGGKVWERTYSIAELTQLANVKGINVGSVISVGITKTGATGRVLELTLYGSAGNYALTKENIRSFFSPNGGSLESRNFVIVGSSSTVEETIIYAEGADGVGLSEIKGAAVIDADGAVTYIQGNSAASVVTANGAASIASETVTYAPPAVGATSFTFKGKGWGHGVGMSQWGAKGLAEAGRGYADILKFYYSGVVVR